MISFYFLTHGGELGVLNALEEIKCAQKVCWWKVRMSARIVSKPFLLGISRGKLAKLLEDDLHGLTMQGQRPIRAKTSVNCWPTSAARDGSLDRMFGDGGAITGDVKYMRPVGSVRQTTE